MDRPAFAQRHAFDLLLKAWQQAPGTEHSVNVFCRAPRKRLAINFAAKAYCDLVALCGRSLAFLGQEGAVNLGKPRDRLLDLHLWDFHLKPLNLNICKAADLDFRQDFEGNRERQIRFCRKDLLDLIPFAGQIDLGLQSNAKLVFLDDLTIGLVDRVLNHIGHDRAAVELF
jgi:hypothetical protein